jgi:hypothetical protein
MPLAVPFSGSFGGSKPRGSTPTPPKQPAPAPAPTSTPAPSTAISIPRLPSVLYTKPNPQQAPFYTQDTRYGTNFGVGGVGVVPEMPYYAPGTLGYAEQLSQQTPIWRLNQTLADDYYAKMNQVATSAGAEITRQTLPLEEAIRQAEIQRELAYQRYLQSQAYLQADANYQTRMLGLDQERLVANRAYNNANYQLSGDSYQNQLRSISRLNQLSQQALEQTLAYLGKQRGFADNRYQNLVDYLGQVDQFANTGYSNTINQLKFNRDRDWRLALSEATGRGAVGSAGYGDTKNEIGQQFQLGSADAQLALDRALADSQRGRTTGWQDYQESLAGIENSESNARLNRRGDIVGFDTQRENARIGYERDTASYQRESKFFDILAKEYGMTAAQIRSALRRGLQNLGLDYNSTIDMLSSSINSNQNQIAATAQAIASAALSYSMYGQ